MGISMPVGPLSHGVGGDAELARLLRIGECLRETDQVDHNRITFLRSKLMLARSEIRERHLGSPCSGCDEGARCVGCCSLFGSGVGLVTVAYPVCWLLVVEVICAALVEWRDVVDYVLTWVKVR